MTSFQSNSNWERDIGPPGRSIPVSEPQHDPMLVSAREVYETYCKVHTDAQDDPVGVAVDQHTFRGQLIFSAQPILLPHESFVPFAQLIQSEAVVSQPEFEYPSIPFED